MKKTTLSFALLALWAGCTTTDQPEASQPESAREEAAGSPAPRAPAAGERAPAAGERAPTPASMPMPADAGAPPAKPKPKPDADAAAPNTPAPSQTSHDDDAGVDAGAAPVTPPATSDAGTPPPQPAADGGIDSVMMDVAYIAGVNGSVVADPRPIIMFKDGWACRDMNYVVSGLDEAGHKAMYPKSWVQWQVIDGKVALQNGSKWTTMYFQLKYPPHDRNLTFDAVFSRFSGLTVGDVTAFSQKAIHMTPDHRVLFGSQSAVTSPVSASSSVPPEQRGSYQVDGYTIEFKWDSGTVTKTSFVYGEDDPNAIYVGGAGFTHS